MLHLDGGETVDGQVPARSPPGPTTAASSVEGCERFEGRGRLLRGDAERGALCRERDVVVVGGGNSAGQAAVFLAGHARRVLLLIRGDDLDKNMSSYLARRIEQTAEHRAAAATPTVRRMHGDGHLDAVEIVDAKTGEERTREHAGGLQLHRRGAADGLAAARRSRPTPAGSCGPGRRWPTLVGRADAREPFLLETSRPGVFAAGDVRSGSVKRVASAVGEGSMAVQFVHEYLKEM